ncbi:NADH dehydrogenase subunit 5 [Iris pallida]|uniref:NADH dehydrogenase subunit 5 (Mitochondrion) n=1 Tax=Iris pallida TaxID=29817 RepID=A0AAX6I9L7_IRIPA|nr:NADH dehydrogenase subunit 5 [Iris pallida]
MMGERGKKPSGWIGKSDLRLSPRLPSLRVAQAPPFLPHYSLLTALASLRLFNTRFFQNLFFPRMNSPDHDESCPPVFLSHWTTGWGAPMNSMI